MLDFVILIVAYLVFGYALAYVCVRRVAATKGTYQATRFADEYATLIAVCLPVSIIWAVGWFLDNQFLVLLRKTKVTEDVDRCADR